MTSLLRRHAAALLLALGILTIAGKAQAREGTLVFYSDIGDGADAVADQPFPTSLDTNTFSANEVGPEGANGFTYRPAAGQPGFVAGVGDPVTYVIRSDAVTAPEPHTIVLMLTGLPRLAESRYSGDVRPELQGAAAEGSLRGSLSCVCHALSERRGDV